MTLMLPSSNAPPELMQLCQAKTLGTFDHHDRRIRNINADFNHRGGNQQIIFAIFKGTHHFLFFRRRHFSMQDRNPTVRKTFAQTISLLRHAFHVFDFLRLGSFDERTNHEHLSPLPDLEVNKMLDGLATVGIHDLCFDFFTIPGLFQ